MSRWRQATSMCFGTVMAVFSASACSETTAVPETVPTYHGDVTPIPAP